MKNKTKTKIKQASKQTKKQGANGYAEPQFEIRMLRKFWF